VISVDARLERSNRSNRWNRSRLRGSIGAATWVGVSVLGGIGVAFLVVNGLWYAAVALVLTLPAFVLLHRAPLAGVAVWLLATPFVAVTQSGSVREAFWLFHRVLPIGLLAILVVATMTRVSPRALAALGWPEVMIAGLVAASVLSIVFTSSAPVATVILLYDRVVVPICLYLIVRLLAPDQRDLMRLGPVVLVVLGIEGLIGLVSLARPGMLPSAWLVGSERATGTFADPDVFGTTMVFCGLFALHWGLTSRRGWVLRIGSVLAFAFAMVMVFLTFSRGNWLAGLVVLAGCAWIYRRYLPTIVVVLSPLLVALLASGLLKGPITFAQERLDSVQSRESALARVPVAVAAIRMVEARPLAGWGYGNFDVYSRPFQTQVGNLVYPEKDHASHNLFLTIMAEQGLLGIALFLGPTVYWLVRTKRVLAAMPSTERKLVESLWLVIAAFVVVNNFSVMKVSFGLGLWWLTLGLIGSTVHRYRASATHPAPIDVDRVNAGDPMAGGGGR
jgi:O-antigen ligase